MYIDQDYDIDFDSDTRIITSFDSSSVRYKAKDDLVPGEVEQFVLEVTKAELTQIMPPRAIKVIIANSLTVVIVDDDGKCIILVFAGLRICAYTCCIPCINLILNFST